MKRPQEVRVTSRSFENGGYIPKKHTGFGEDISPAFQLSGLSPEAVSIAITMDDLDIPFISSLNHWLIWNIPKSEIIPENIPYGPTVPALSDAKQGIAYGRSRYRGPKQPVFVRKMHRYLFRFYVLDCFLQLGSNARKPDLLKAMDGHVLQQGDITGKYQR
ncbi:MAG: YbhB/YbcL family Raf kinase inhibitor-like protein [Eubacteriales bacterium]|nr:YbhB/YbcL family Raf kinase inhibitor-like protein [Eubacteriales bacterium]